MPGDANQRIAFQFLKERLFDQQSFTKTDLRDLTTWKPDAFRTYWTKQFKRFMVPLPGKRFRVGESFRPYVIWEKFQQHVTQMRNAGATAYRRQSFDLVRIFEFYMPLTHEYSLKITLDALFYEDIIRPKLRALDEIELNRHFPRDASETEAKHFDRICAYLNKKFRGYSVNHVGGRFRMEPLTTQQKAAEIQIDGRPYVMDETTAVTRFILPCDSNTDAEVVWFFFENLFVKSILQLVNGEAEVWMVETGMNQRVWIWRVPDQDDEEEDDESRGSEGPLSL